MKAKIFLVDDEQPVLDGLSVSIRKIAPDLKICGTAKSGLEALEGIAAQKPDIIMMDVRMPGMSGIDALREARKMLPESVTILLTAYERFDIAQEAYALGVYKYLVKPVTQEALRETLSGALEKLKETKAAALSSVAEQEILGKTRPLLEAGFVWAALYSDPRSPLLAEFAEALGFLADHHLRGHFALVYREKNRIEIDEACDLSREITNRLECVAGPLIGGMLPLFVAGDNYNRTRHILKEALGAGGLRFETGFAAEDGSLRRSWAQALDSAGNARRDAEKKPQGETADDVQMLFELLNEGDMVRLRSAFFAWAGGASAFQRAVIASSLCAAQGASAEQILYAAETQIAAEGIDEKESSAYAADMLQASLAAVTPREDESYSGNDKRVRLALKFIADHYGEQISLDDAAAAAKISPAHLSRLFPAETGVTFSRTLSSYRIARACRDLAAGKMSLKESAAACGYPDANYFSRAFKKVLGTTPSEWVAKQEAGL
jgi:two-component system response regulator YesN